MCDFILNLYYIFGQVTRMFILLDLVPIVSAKVSWNLITNPVVLGSDVVLFCNTSEAVNDCYACLTEWYGGPENSIISMDEYTVNDDKYSFSKDNEGFSLTIHNFGLSDANKEYQCSRGFDFHKKTLNISESSLIRASTGGIALSSNPVDTEVDRNLEDEIIDVPSNNEDLAALLANPFDARDIEKNEPNNRKEELSIPLNVGITRTSSMIVVLSFIIATLMR